METFAELKEFLENPYYRVQKQKTLSGLTDDMIDAPIIGLVRGFNEMSCCFTLQSCYGHFVCTGQTDPYNLETLPLHGATDKVAYRIAYIAFCIENSDAGTRLFEALKDVTSIDLENIQFCCAEWFWNRQINSYALQVQPDRFRCQDTAVLDLNEALRIQLTRDKFFSRLCELLEQM